MKLAAVVDHPRNPGMFLLRPGVVLGEYEIMRLREIECEEVWIEYPGLDFVREHVCPEVFLERGKVAQQVGNAFRAALRGSRARLDWPAYRDSVSSLLDRLTATRAASVFVQQTSRLDPPMLAHAVNVCHLSLLMGLRLDFYLVHERARIPASAAKNAVNLGLGAMVHDLGMLDLDAETLARWNQSQDETDPAFQQHVLHGYNRVRGQIDPSAAAVVLHHHQKFDGTGYPLVQSGQADPRQAAGHDIHVFARIATVADLFDRLRYPPGMNGRVARMSTVRALNLLRSGPMAAWIDPVCYRALLACVPAFTPGTMVVLSDGRRAVITGWNPEHPCQPTVEILNLACMADEYEQRERLDLRQTPDIKVVWADGFDVSEDLFFPATPGEFALVGEGAWAEA
jgi:HD-GYP domain-containing protein (c-di-GMP phosphodiesterase class II)